MARWVLRPEDVPFLSRGCAVLGSGGGGQVASAALVLESSLSTRPAEVVDLDDLPPGAVVALVGAVGSPTVMQERLPGHSEFVGAVRTWEQHSRRALDAVGILEIGGINGLLGINTAARLGLPVLDADGMGRAFPRLDMTTVAGRVPATPVVLADARGGRLILEGVPDHAVEDAVRRVLPSFGTWAAICLHGGEVGAAGDLVRGSVSRALALGRALGPQVAGEPGGSPPGTGPDVVGTVVQVLRPPGAPGVVTLEAHDAASSTLRVDFLEEFLVASLDGDPVAWAPDVIALLDPRTNAPVLVDELRVGQRLRLLTLAPTPELVAHQDRLGLAGYGLVPLARGYR